MPSSIRLRCPGCDARIKAPAQLKGQTRNCPRCTHPLLIKLRPPEDSAPMFLRDDAGPARRRFAETF